jgi:hypothetical protein
MQKFVDLPEKVEVGIVAVVGFAVGFVFMWAGEIPLLAPIVAFLVQYQLAIVGAIGFAVVKWLENALPDGSDVVANLSIKLILTVLSLFGIGSYVAEFLLASS